MSAVYRPLSLVHAHLPPPPSVPYAIPGLRVPTSLDFPTSSSSSSSSLHPQHAQSAAYSESAGVLGRIVLNCHALELRNFDLALSKAHMRPARGSETVRILFPEALRDIGEGFAVLSTKRGRLFVFVLTESAVLYRLNFPLGSYAGESGQRLSFVVEGSAWCEEWAVPDDTLNAAGGVGCWKVVDEAHVVLGMGDGGIVSLARSPQGSWTASHHRASSRLRLGGFFGRTTDESVSSLELYRQQDGSRILYSLSRDWKLRIWNAANGSLLRTTDIVTVDGIEPGVIPLESAVPLLRTIRHPSPSSRYSHLVVIYLYPLPNSMSSGSFAIYRASGTELVFAGEKLGSAATLGGEMRGFEILPPPEGETQFTGYRLQASWYHDGQVVVETVGMDDVFQFSTYVPPLAYNLLLEAWQPTTTVNFEDLRQRHAFEVLVEQRIQALDATDDADLAQVFLQEIFRPGRYSVLTLQSALEDYVHQSKSRSHASSSDPVQAAYPTLSQKYAAVIGNHLEVEHNAQTGAAMILEYRQALRQEWLGVWARCRELDRQGRWPLSVTRQAGYNVVLDREGFAVVSDEDVASVLDRASGDPVFADNLLSLSDDALWSSLDAVRSGDTRSDAVTLLTGARQLVSGVDAAVRAAGRADEPNADQSLFFDLLGLLAAGQATSIESIAASCWDEYIADNLSDDTVQEVQRCLERCTDTTSALRAALDIFAAAKDPSAMAKTARDGLSGSGNALLASALTASIEARLAVSKHLVLIAFFLLASAEGGATSGETDESEELIHELARTVVCFHRYHTLNEWCLSTGEEAVERAKSRTGGKRRAASDLSKPKADEGRYVDADDFDLEYSLLHTMLARQRSDFGLQRDHFISDLAVQHVARLDLLDSTQTDCAPRRQDIDFLYRVLAAGQPGTAARLASIYPYSAGTAYIIGRSFVEDGLVEEAVRDLEAAVDAVEDGTLDLAIPSRSPSDYYRHLCKVFDDAGAAGPVAHFGQKILRLHAPADSSTRDICARVFLAYISLSQFEDAYQIMALCPHLDLRRDLLSQLISVMCEANEVGRLTTLGFIGLQKEAEAILSFKARNSDPLRFPNYYKVLYTWHISRGDYRSAGEIMYIQGTRLGDVLESGNSKLPVFEIRAMQARNLLAAVNALSLVDKRFAWVATSEGSARKSALKRKRTSSYIPTDVFAPDKHAITLVTLEDIEAEYRLVLASLQLSRQFEELHEHGVSVKADEIVGLLVQRNMFDQAQSAAESLKVDMTHLFVALATKCVDLARLSTLSVDSSAAAFLQSSPLTARLRGSPAAVALRYLQISLSRHDSVATQFRYREAVADALFEQSRDRRFGWQMPLWLVSWEMERDPEGWIGRALKWGWVKEAVEWSAQLLRDAKPPELLGKNEVGYVPYALIDRVIAVGREGEEAKDTSLQKQVTSLHDEVKRRLEGLKGRSV